MGYFSIRALLLAAVMLAALISPGNGVAAVCPELQGELIRWVVPTRPGGGYDRYSRLIQPFLEQTLDTQIVIDTRTEAGGIVGALAIRNANADGKTLGMINASGLLAANALPDSKAPDPLQDFSILARIVSNRMVVFAGRDSGITDINALLALSNSRSVVVGVRDVGSASFFALPVTASLLGLDYSVVAGYVGSASRVLAAIRGDVDIIMQNFDSVSSYVDSGELVPLLEISPRVNQRLQSDADQPIPWLSGQGGLAVQVATSRNRSVDEAIEQADALSAAMSAGRLVVAPAGLPASLETCLQASLMEVLVSKEFNEAAENARLTIQATDAATAESELLSSMNSMAGFGQLVRSAIERARL